MSDRKSWALAAWLVVLLAGQVVAFLALRRFFVYTRHGQLFDAMALAGDTIGRHHVDRVVDTVLNAISVLSLAAVTAVIGFIALMRRRVVLAVMAVLLVAGANVTTQILKYGYGRPDFGADGALARFGNTLPSGHATVAASVAAALILVLPPRLRGLGGVLGTGYAALTGVFTLSAGWHRASDAIAAMLVVGGWAAFVGLLLVLFARRDRWVRGREAHPIAVTLLLTVGVMLLAAFAVGLKLTDRVLLIPPDQLSWRRLFVAYAGGAAGIAGTAGVVMAFLLATVHAVVPYQPRWALTDGAEEPAPVALED